MFRSLRVRLTMTFVLVGGVLIAIGFAGAAWLLHRAVWDPLDAALRRDASSLAIVLETEQEEEGSEPSSPPTGNDEVDGNGDDDVDDDVDTVIRRVAEQRDLGSGKFVMVSSDTGAMLKVSGHLPSSLDLANLADLGDAAAFLEDDAGSFRIVCHQVRGVGRVTVGVGAGRYWAAVRRAKTGLAAGAIAMLVAIGLLAWAVTTRAVREIGKLTEQLEDIEEDSLDRRLGPPRTTEVIRLSDALNRLLNRLEAAVKRAQRFTADAAHELRTPLAALRAHLDVALARPPTVDGYRNGLLDASEQAERLAILAEDLLTLSTIESGRCIDAQPVDLGTLASEVAEFLEAVALEQERKFSVQIAQDALIDGEAPLLKRLLINLLGNAFTHTEKCAAVELAVQRTDAGVVLVVRDHGPGISRDQQRVLFERFAASPHRKGGAGLGLPICREIVLRHNGTLSITSEMGEGTTVTIRFPSTKS